MKKSNLLKIIPLTFIVSITMIGVAAQTSVKPAIKVNGDTVFAKRSPLMFDVQLIPEPDDQKFMLSIINPSAEKLRITISAADGIGFMDNTKEPAYRKRISMTEAHDGDYTVTVAGAKKTFTKVIHLQTEVIQTRNISIE